MIRFALLADIHGNLPALKSVLDALAPDSPDGILVAGDWISGPACSECIELLQEHATTSILGNSDIRLLEFLDGKAPPYWHTLQQFAMVRWDAEHMTARAKTFLHSLPGQRVVAPAGTAPIRIVHGSLDSAFEGLSMERHPDWVEDTFSRLRESVLVCGHTHRPWFQHSDGKLIVNPGSVSAPLNGDTYAQYALLDWCNGAWQVELRRVDYDHAELVRLFDQSGFLDACSPLARCFMETMLSGVDVTWEFFELVNRLAEERNIELEDYAPDEYWSEAAAKFDWAAVEKRRKTP